MANVKLVPLEEGDRNRFILDNQEAFRHGAMEELGGMFRFEKVMKRV